MKTLLSPRQQQMGIPIKFVLVLRQCRCGPDRLLHRDWSHAGEDEAREVCGHLWSRHMHAGSEELHGADRGSVHIHPRGTAGSCDVWQHRSPCPKPVRPHPEAHPDPSWRDCHLHGTGVQSRCLLFLMISVGGHGEFVQLDISYEGHYNHISGLIQCGTMEK